MTTACTVFDCADPAALVPVGSFAIDAAGNGHFAYGRQYLDQLHSFDLDPIHLPRSAAPLVLPRRLDGSYGVLSDAGPNAWGVKLATSILTRENLPLPANPVEWLLNSWHFGSGCLGFSRHHTEKPGLGMPASKTAELTGKLLQTIAALASNQEVDLTDADIRLLAPGSSLGGVRPKTIVIHDGTEHIAKFSRPDLVPHISAATHPQSIGVGAQGAASTVANALSQCGRFLLKPAEASAIVESVRSVVAGWMVDFRQAGICRSDIAVLANCISVQR